MKLLGRYIDKNSSGDVALNPEEPEDMWHAYNLICIGDSLRSTTIRKVATSTETGTRQTEKKRTTLTIEVTATDFDMHGCLLRVSGRNIRENQFVKMGAYHTLDLELNRKFTIGKHHWDSIALERIEDACDPSRKADLAAVVMQEGLANVCLVTNHMTLVRQKIDVSIPRKRSGQCGQHDKGMAKFYEHVAQAVQRHINFEIVKCVIIASPGFVKDKFFEYLFAQAAKNGNKELLDNKGKFVLAHSSSGFKHSLKDVLADPNVGARLTNVKSAGEVRALNDFYQMLQADPDRAFYGLSQIKIANEQEAIERFLICDSLFRSNDLATRKLYVKLVDDVRSYGGDVKIFSVLHVSGEQLNQLGGIAAILRYPIPDLEDSLSEDEAEGAVNGVA